MRWRSESASVAMTSTQMCTTECDKSDMTGVFGSHRLNLSLKNSVSIPQMQNRDCAAELSCGNLLPNTLLSTLFIFDQGYNCARVMLVMQVGLYRVVPNHVAFLLKLPLTPISNGSEYRLYIAMPMCLNFLEGWRWAVELKIRNLADGCTCKCGSTIVHVIKCYCLSHRQMFAV
jgi:hypothetical protein